MTRRAAVRQVLSAWGVALAALALVVTSGRGAHGQIYSRAPSGAGSPVYSGGAIGTPVLAPDGTAPLPAYSFSNEPTLGFWRSAAATITATGQLVGTTFIAAATGNFYWTGRLVMASPVNGAVNFSNNAQTIGSQLKVDALPTIASGFGTSPSITAGSTPLAGSVNVGTGGSATNGVINFAGTAFPSAPFCIATNATSHASPSQAAATTTQLTLFAVTAWPASSVVSWICISSK